MNTTALLRRAPPASRAPLALLALLPLAACGDDKVAAQDTLAPEVDADDTGDATGEVEDGVDADADSADAVEDGDACAPGELGCACDADDACAADELVCDAGSHLCRAAVACADAGCANHQLCAQAAGVDAACLPACDSGYSWNAGTLACDANPVAHCGQSASDPNAIGDDCAAAGRVCVAASGADPAHCGDCVSGYLEDGSACRAPRTCSAIGCDAQHRLCIEATRTPAADAQCGDCQASYELDPDGACAKPASCAELGCAALGRSCVDNGFALCGDCLDGLSPKVPADPMSACVEGLGCRDLDCGDDYCIESSSVGVDATCAASTCGAGEAKNQATGACVTCNGSCTKTGETGRFWLYTRSNGSCVCETSEDWYLDTTLGATPKPCDADGDGWVRSSAQPFVEPTGSLDAAVAANARCLVHHIDRVTLQNEWAQRYVVRPCTAPHGPVAEGATCAGTEAVSLYEKTELDDDASLTDLVRYPVYSHDGVGRQLSASEVNPLTKACVSAAADLDGNGIEDVEEAAEMEVPAAVTLTDLQATLLHFGYFVELHTSSYEDRPGEDYGTLVIGERSRCDDAFPLTYAASADPYWRQCTRNRKATFDRAAALPGFDLARWSCDATSGSCPELPAPTTLTPVTTIPAHGLCQVSRPPADGVWRGMNHHSQFRCVEVTAGAASESWQLAKADLYDATTQSAGRYQFDGCGVSGSASPHGSGEPAAPVIACAPELPEAGAVGFVAARYDDDRAPADYREGCIDEWRTWPELCPGWDASLPEDDQAAVGDGQSQAFGELICGCAEAFGGIACQTGCGAGDLMLSTGYATVPRDGYWLCGDLAASGCAERCPSDVAIDDFASQASGWTLGGAAAFEGTRVRLTPDSANVTGYAFRDARTYVETGFTADLSFEMTASSGAGGSGLAFVVQADAASDSDDSGSGKGLAVSFDSQADGASETADGVVVRVNGSVVASSYVSGDWSNSGIHAARVAWFGDELVVSVDGVERVRLTLALAAASVWDASGEASVGFGARSGSAAETHDVTSFNLGCIAACDETAQVLSDAGTVWTLDAGIGQSISGASLYQGSTPCASLGLDASLHGATGVCGGTPGCSGAMAFDAAQTLCAASGMRLCTLAELHADEAADGACGYDAARVWSSTTCAGGVQTAAGAAANAGAVPDQCTATSGSADVRCCADTTASGWRLR
ncbi:MAG: hypothetical protein U1F43_17055 [Myxococcota bacterium]